MSERPEGVGFGASHRAQYLRSGEMMVVWEKEERKFSGLLLCISDWYFFWFACMSAQERQQIVNQSIPVNAGVGDSGNITNWTGSLC